MKRTTPTLPQQFIVVALSFACVFFVGCASTVSSPVTDENKDTSNVFEGRWVANVQRTAGTQLMPGNWRMSCYTKPYIRRLTVANGRIALTDQRPVAFTYVNSEGQFRFEVPLTEKATESAISDLKILAGERTLILYGNLNTGKGRITYGVAQFGNNGCTAKIEFTDG